MSNVRNLHVSAATFTRGTLVTYQRMPMVVVHVKGAYADLAPGDDVAAATAVSRVLTHVSKLARRKPREHYVTIEPALPAGDDGMPPRLCVAEYQTGEPVWLHGVEGWLPLAELRGRARDVAARLGVEFREPVDELAVELLSGVNA